MPNNCENFSRDVKYPHIQYFRENAIHLYVENYTQFFCTRKLRTTRYNFISFTPTVHVSFIIKNVSIISNSSRKVEKGEKN